LVTEAVFLNLKV